MSSTIIDTRTMTERILSAPPTDRPGLLDQLWAPVAGMYAFIPGGPSWPEVHRRSSGFDPDGDPAALRAGLTALADADAWNRVGHAADEALVRLREAAPGVSAPDPTVLLILGDPEDEHFMDEVQGLSAFGGMSGYVTITLWPTATVLDRLEAIVAHELHHNVRYSPGGVVWDPRSVTVGEQVVAEGLADLFAVERYGERGRTHFVDPALLEDDAVLARVVSGLSESDPMRFPAWVLGDATARAVGVEPAGVPTGAGYAVGARIAAAYLASTGLTAAEAVAAPSHEVIATGLSALGVEPPRP
ncbi:DUF2268 domain-containing protein [Actinomyces haliotis]|uniref:DUF2268 domain-containing protein n=1 Tax=Actinomyces haliotis TaxID=1280843 RepID=UPI0018902E5D|nr:DUF2268 domain-containing putative Zn-dependent protease [Actinomyces haliotis]